jgi:hypothetical protein
VIVSPPDSSKFSGEKPKSDVYTMMLLVAFIALVAACVMLWLEGSSYGAWPWWKVPRI